jgi:hypothetical protein
METINLETKISLFAEFFYNLKKDDATINNAINFMLGCGYEHDDNLITSTCIIYYAMLMDPTHVDQYITTEVSFYDCIKITDQREFMGLIMTKIKPLKDISEIKNYIIKRLECSLPFIHEMSSRRYSLDENCSTKNYMKFLQLKKKYTLKRISPSKCIDVVWHAHMCDHTAYILDTFKYFGYVLPHDDQPNENETIVQRETKELWFSEYGEEIIPNEIPLDNNSNEKKMSFRFASCG